ncbi:MAG: flagellar export chaperone FliS [Thermodesulfobacteriota bacterium]|nr:flagellar export chaperone FliS [Thermodesulfobacteriota bacterium]
MNPTAAYSKYQKFQITGQKDQGEMVLMLYGGALKFLYQAEKYLEEKDIESVHNNLIRAEKIIKELISTLNMEAGEIAHNLLSLYVYMDRRLYEANSKKDIQGIKEVIELLNELKGAWTKAIQNLKENDEEHRTVKTETEKVKGTSFDVQQKNNLRITC